MVTKNITKTDLCVIGAGSGGLSVAAGAVQMGARVVLIEKHKMGGDCLNTGCVPSKALLAAAKHADILRHGAPYGVKPVEPEIDFAAANAHVHRVIKGIEPHDSVERFTELGVDVIEAAAKFTGPAEVSAGGRIIHAKKFIIATGSTARIVPIPGIEETEYLTNENIFDLRECPAHLIIVGGGPIGIEMAQAHKRLGAQVTVLEKFTALPKDDPELTRIALASLREEGINILEGVDIQSVSGTTGDITITLADGKTITGSHLLLATGRSPNITGLGLEAAGVHSNQHGIQVDARLRTSNKRIFAIGDVKGGMMFTHAAGYDAGIIIRNILFKMPAKADYSCMPYVTYSEPELAQVGYTEAAAKEKFGETVKAITWQYAENDRARTELLTNGMIKVVIDRKGKILGAGIVGTSAGELIQTWQLALSKGMKIGDMAAMIAPYPTLAEISKRVAGSHFTPALFSDRTRKIVKFLLKF
ncbi:MAG: FAD-dependent oxidoreductase [Robiginitomaculum sp.]|nr:FAD-dependent oxidoreductase [Robiginitomaculum sp.]